MQCLYLQNNTHTLWNNSCSFSRDLVYGTRWTNPPFRRFVSITNGVMLLWTTTVLSDKLDISLRLSNSTGQTQLDILRDVIVKIFPLAIWPVSRLVRSHFKDEISRVCGKPLEVHPPSDIHTNYCLKPNVIIICLARLMVMKVKLFFDMIFLFMLPLAWKFFKIISLSSNYSVP